MMARRGWCSACREEDDNDGDDLDFISGRGDGRRVVTTERPK